MLRLILGIEIIYHITLTLLHLCFSHDELVTIMTLSIVTIVLKDVLYQNENEIKRTKMINFEKNENEIMKKMK